MAAGFIVNSNSYRVFPPNMCYDFSDKPELFSIEWYMDYIPGFSEEAYEVFHKFSNANLKDAASNLQ